MRVVAKMKAFIRIQSRFFATATSSSATTAKAASLSTTVPPPPGYRPFKVLANQKTVRAYEGKLKDKFKRAGGLLNELDKELVQHARATYKRPQWDDIKPGDAVEVLYKESGASIRSQMSSGVCIATKRLGGWNASAKVMSVLGPHPVEYHFPLYSPLVSHVRMVQESFIHKGAKRVKRAKLYYLRDRPMGELRTPPSEMTKDDREKALIVARRVSAEAKMGKKEKAERDAKKK